MIEKCKEAIKNRDLVKAIKLAKESVKAYPNNFESYLCLASVYYNIRNFKEALENFKKAEKLTNNEEKLIDIYYYMAEIFVDMNKLDDAITYFKKTLNLAKRTNNNRSYIFSRIADIYFKKGDFEKSAEYYDKAFKSGKEEDLGIEFIAGIINNQSIALIKLGYYEGAIKLLKDLLALGSTSNNPIIICLSEINLGSAYSMMGDKETAKKYLISGLKHAKELKDKGLEAIAYMHLGDILNNKSYSDKAEQIFKELNGAYNQLN